MTRQAVGIVLAMALAGCARSGQEVSLVPSGEAEPAPVAEVSAGAPNDAEIAAIVVAANGTDADLGEFAAGRASATAVQEFARTMVRDHRAVNEQAAALVAKLGVAPRESELSRSLRDGGEAVRAQLEPLGGAEFDRAYIAHEVGYHAAVIEAVDRTLVPSARNAELRETLLAVRPALVAHLEHARQLAASLR